MKNTKNMQKMFLNAKNIQKNAKNAKISKKNVLVHKITYVYLIFIWPSINEN